MTAAVFLFILSKVLWDVARVLKSLTPESLSALEKGITHAYVATHDFNAMSFGFRSVSLYFDVRSRGFKAFLFDFSLCFFWVLWIWVYLHDKKLISALEFFRADNLNAVFLMGSICAAVVLFAHSIHTRALMRFLPIRSTQSNWPTLAFFVSSLLTLWAFACLANGLFGSFGLV